MNTGRYTEIRSLRESIGESYYFLMSYKYERLAIKELVQSKLQEAKRQGISIYELDARTQYNLVLKKYNVLSKERQYKSNYNISDKETFRLSVGDLIDIRRKFYDFEQWYEWRTFSSGGRYKYWGKPKPYCSEYFQYFMREIMRLDWEKIGSWLNENFIGDVVDRDYIEGLLSCAEIDFGLSQKNSCLVFEQNGIAGYNLKSDSINSITNEAPNANIILGGDNYCRRATMIREIIRPWHQLDTETPVNELICKDFESYTTELMQSMEWNNDYDELLTRPTVDAYPAEQQVRYAEMRTEGLQQNSADSSESPAAEAETQKRVDRNTTERGGQRAERLAIELESEITGLFTTDCDKLAKKIKLCPPNEPYIHQSDGHTRIWAFADALKAEGRTGAAVRLAQLLGKRYGYVVGPKLTNKAENNTYNRLVKFLIDEIQKI